MNVYWVINYIKKFLVLNYLNLLNMFSKLLIKIFSNIAKCKYNKILLFITNRQW